MTVYGKTRSEDKSQTAYNIAGNIKQDRQCTNNGTMRRIHATIVAVEKQ